MNIMKGLLLISNILLQYIISNNIYYKLILYIFISINNFQK